MSQKLCAHYTLGARYRSENTVLVFWDVVPCNMVEISTWPHIAQDCILHSGS